MLGPARALDHPHGAGVDDGTPAIPVQTYADRWRVVREPGGPFTRRRIVVPDGRVHAAHEPGTTLCGLATDELLRFGRRLYPFEEFPTARQCPACLRGGRVASRPGAVT